MIYDVLNALDAIQQDPVLGVNARLDTWNQRYGLTVQPVAEFHTWDLSKLPSEMTLPTLQLVWDGTPELPLGFENLWDAQHSLRWLYWTDEVHDHDARRNLTATAWALRKVLDSCLGLETATGSIAEIAAASMQVAGWTQPQEARFYTFMSLGFTVHERDTTT